MSVQATETNKQPVAQGIETLIQSLRQDGVDAGKQEAEALLSEARQEAEAVLAKARQEAEALVSQAHKEADFIRESGQQAFEMAQRNSLLELKGALQTQFAEHLKQSVAQAMTDPVLLKQMIVSVAGNHHAPAGEAVEVLLPAEQVSYEELQAAPEQLKPGSLMHFVAAESAEMLREGVSFNVCEDNQHALVFRLQGQDIEVALSDETVSHMLLGHLQPRFRALCDGLVG